MAYHFGFRGCLPQRGDEKFAPMHWSLQFSKAGPLLTPAGYTGTAMLESGKLVGFLFTQDYDRARAFYEGRLGCTFITQDQFALVLSLGGHKIRIVEMPNFTPSQATVLGWEVSNIEEVAAWLQQQGVPLQIYPWVQDKERGIWTTPGGDQVAWFQDPDGNVLSVSQHR